MAAMPKTETHVLYRFFNEAGELLYVGITKDPFNRFKGHQSEKQWFPEVSRSTMQHFPTRADLIVAEEKAIQEESPKYNIALSGRPPSAPTLKIRGEHSQARSVFGPDASTFPKPDGIADDDPAPDLASESHPCFVCNKTWVVREVDGYGNPLNDQLRCLHCQAKWTEAEWVEAIITVYRRRVEA